MILSQHKNQYNKTFFKEVFMAAKPVYVRCPRCELNYIKKGEKLCSVCKSELDGTSELDELDLEYCPVCKTNYIQPDEIMCATCAKERSLDSNFQGDEYENDEWDEYINAKDTDGYEEDDDDDLTQVHDADDDDDLMGSDDLPLELEDDFDEDSDEDDEEDEDEDDDDDDLEFDPADDDDLDEEDEENEDIDD